MVYTHIVAIARSTDVRSVTFDGVIHLNFQTLNKHLNLCEYQPTINGFPCLHYHIVRLRS